MCKTDHSRANANLIPLTQNANKLRNPTLQHHEILAHLFYISQYHWVLLDALDSLIPYKEIYLDSASSDRTNNIDLQEIANDLRGCLKSRIERKEAHTA